MEKCQLSEIHKNSSKRVFSQHFLTNEEERTFFTRSKLQKIVVPEQTKNGTIAKERNTDIKTTKQLDIHKPHDKGIRLVFKALP